MKIAFPLLNEYELATDFSKSTLIGIYDDDMKEIEYLKPSSYESTMTSFILGELLKIKDLECIISPSLSFMALRVLKEYDFRVLQAQGNDFLVNIELYNNNSLALLSSMDAFLQNCSGSCSSCNTTCSTN